MIEDYTKKYFKYKNNNSERIDLEELTTKELKRTLCVLDDKLNLLNKNLDLNTLPTFQENNRLELEINEIKVSIEELVKLYIEKLNELTNKLENDLLKTTITNYFESLIDKTKLKYQTIIFEYLKKIEKVNEFKPVLEEIQDIEISFTNPKIVTQFQSNQLIMASKFDNTRLNTSLLGIGKILTELKMAIKSQEHSINNLDEYLESANRYMEVANKEIKRIPDFWITFKNRIICFELAIIVVQLILLILKEVKN